MNFVKMHGLGNDFVILDHRKGGAAPDSARIQHICDRHFGIGCDQLIILEPSRAAGVFMRIYNPDGSEAESCGNATRCVADLCMKEGREAAFTIETRAGILKCRKLPDGLIEVDMGSPVQVTDMAFAAGGFKNPVSVNMGNPHCVFFVDNAEDIPLETLGASIENDKAFPNKTNVEFAHITKGGQIRLRVWERGAGVTLACGSGACATMVAAAHKGLTGRKAEIVMDGGVLSLEWRESDGHVLMTGPVAYVFEGTLK